MEERENRDTAATARSLSVVHYTERDQDSAARLVAGLVERSASAAGSPSFVAVLPSADDALSLCEAVRTHRRGDRALAPVTSVARGRRLLTVGSTAIAGSPAELARLIAESRLMLSQLHTLVLVWPEEIVADEEQRKSLESLIGEVPKATERAAICAARTPELAQWLERSMWKARAVNHAAPPVSTTDSPLRVIAAASTERVRALRSLLDALDPQSAILFTFSDESEAAARDAASILGSEGGLIQVSRGVPEGRFGLGIIFDDMPTAEAITAASANVDELVAIVRPSRLAALNKVATKATPFAWTGALANARSAHDALRDEIRGYTGSGAHVQWVPIVEPLLEGLDAVDIAAAALALLDRERRKTKRAATVIPAPTPPAAERPARESRPGSFGARPGARRDDARGDRPERGFPKKRPSGAWGQSGARKRDDDPRRGPPRERSDRPRRDDRGPAKEGRGRDDTRDRRGRPGEIERVPRAAHEGREWTERSERLRNSRRGPRTGEGG